MHFDDCGADNAGQENAKHAKAENQSPTNIQLQECHGEFP
jgi:hypothetical protein